MRILKLACLDQHGRHAASGRDGARGFFCRFDVWNQEVVEAGEAEHFGRQRAGQRGPAADLQPAFAQVAFEAVRDEMKPIWTAERPSSFLISGLAIEIVARSA